MPAILTRASPPWQSAAMDALHGLSLVDVLREHRRSWPSKLAVADGDLRLTYDELDRRSTQGAHALQRLGVGPGDRVLWLGQNSARVLELLLASAKVGAYFCPANWRQTADELGHILDDLTPRVVVWEESEAVSAAQEASSDLDARWIKSGEA